MSDFRRGFWRLADPKISLASIAGMWLGAAAAASSAGAANLAWGRLGAAVFGVLALEVAKNASGEVVDYDSGTDLRVAAADRSPFSGGKRVLVDALLSRRQTIALAAAAYAAGIATGLALLAVAPPGILWLGLAGVALAYFYHAPPLRLAYRGLGEIAVALCYGPLITSGTCLVARDSVPAAVVWLSLPLGLLVAAFLWINEFPDFAADRESGKRTLVVRLGRRRASRAFAAILATAFAVLAALPLAGLPATVWIGFVAALPAAAAARRLLAHPEETARIVPAQAWTLQSFLLYALGAGAGMLIG